jgi:hypothetical protein
VPARDARTLLSSPDPARTNSAISPSWAPTLDHLAHDDQRTLDDEPAAIEIDRRPSPAERLTPSHPGVDETPVERRDPVIGDYSEEGTDIVNGPRRQLRSRHRRRFHQPATLRGTSPNRSASASDRRSAMWTLRTVFGKSPPPNRWLLSSTHPPRPCRSRSDVSAAGAARVAG